ncbi:MAG: queuosine precursor transporter [Owenweeksia sp.]|nr:queuosine precursor transporter [Owenweeksia sp.]
MSDTLNRKEIPRASKAAFLFLILAGLFITALVSCNLIANKFVSVNLGFKTFEVSAGVLPYPLTFLITDILSEIYGRKKTNAVVATGFFSSLLVLLILYLGHSFPALESSPVSQAEYASVFRNSWRVILASMVAYLVAQFIDVRIFHFWKKKTRGRHLWFRNNFSTMFSQLIDTILVTSVIFIGVASFDFISGLVMDGWLFKLIFAAVDTLLIYPVVFVIRSYFNLEVNQELDF